MKRVLIADDHILVRIGLNLLVKETLGSSCSIAFACNGSEVLTALELDKFDILITDINMPQTDGIDMITKALAITPALKILVVTVNAENAFSTRYLRAGAFGFICKDEPDQVLKEAIFNIGQGKRHITSKQAELFSSFFIDGIHDNPFQALSTREFEVTLLLLKGFGGIEVANALSINSSTASTFRRRIFAKLSIKSLVELSRLAQQYHIVEE